ncbi:hypothetical protein CRE_17241 [Caenorhabditis remanei]|uniref:Uncharacterized protein n=1 Tax=Caenorhabditis remanei TaxID=31234 RepID=E3MAB1_CAERE|nr:hypothetical protein CRE_17241 [Caenorhabditis remanei]
MEVPEQPTDTEVKPTLNVEEEIGTQEDVDRLLLQSMEDEARKDPEKFFMQIMEEGDTNPQRKTIQRVHITRFLEKRLEVLSTIRNKTARQMHEIFRMLKEFNYGWLRQLIALCFYEEHPGFYIVQHCFYLYMMKQIRFQVDDKRLFKNDSIGKQRREVYYLEKAKEAEDKKAMEAAKKRQDMESEKENKAECGAEEAEDGKAEEAGSESTETTNYGVGTGAKEQDTLETIDEETPDAEDEAVEEVTEST